MFYLLSYQPCRIVSLTYLVIKLQLDIPKILAAILFKSQWLSGRASDFKSGVLGSNPGGGETKFEVEKITRGDFHFTLNPTIRVYILRF